MKKTLLVAAMVLIGFGTAGAGELKVQVPVNEYDQMRSRLETLENENTQLKQEISSVGSSSPVQPAPQPVLSAGPSEEMISKLSGLESENESLKREIESLQSSLRQAEAESSAAAPPPSLTDAELEERISSLERENLKLERKIQSYKDRGLRVIDHDRRTARQVYSDFLKAGAVEAAE